MSLLAAVDGGVRAHTPYLESILAASLGQLSLVATSTSPLSLAVVTVISSHVIPSASVVSASASAATDDASSPSVEMGQDCRTAVMGRTKASPAIASEINEVALSFFILEGDE